MMPGNGSQTFRKYLRAKCIPDLFVAQTQLDIDIYSASWSIPKSNFRIYGYPRVHNLITNYHPKPILLWAPTWREPEWNSGQYMYPDQQVWMSINKFLQRRNISMLIKEHPYSCTQPPPFVDSLSNISILDKSSDINTILKQTSYLITDYSSTFIDFYNVSKNISFYCPDLSLYASRRGIAPVFHEMLKTLSTDSLKDAINDVVSPHSNLELSGIIDIPSNYGHVNMRILSHYFNHSNHV